MVSNIRPGMSLNSTTKRCLLWSIFEKPPVKPEDLEYLVVELFINKEGSPELSGE